MSDIAIRVENLGKQYKIGRLQKRNDTLRDALAYRLSRVANRVSSNGNVPSADAAQPSVLTPQSSEYIWALRDVSFEVKRGEVVGIIGRNGAGKSTLLKILSRITEPTTGSVDIYGRVASLLEVGTGFHPELTGRENIFLNGAILGMRKAEIEKKFDEIVAFAEVEKFIDTPVKRYSSGMYVRLAFAVAAHLEPEILLVDEVLAVGDADFQKKCLGKMGDVAKEGRTVLFVSHNMGAVATLVSKCFMIEKGYLVKDGEPRQVIEYYLYQNFPQSGQIVYPEAPEKQAQVTRVAIRDSAGKINGTLDPLEPITVEVDFVVRASPRRMHLSFMLHLADNTRLLDVSTDADSQMPQTWSVGRHRLQMIFPGGVLNCGRYLVRTGIGRDDGTVLDHHQSDGLAFELSEASEAGAGGVHMQRQLGLLIIKPEYRITRLNGASQI